MAGAVRPVARLDQGEADDLEAVRLPHQAQEGDVPAPLVPEVEVLADDDGLGAEAADEALDDEVLGRLVRPGAVEGDDQRVVDSRGLEQLQFLVEVSEEPGRRLGAHDHRRVAVEGDDGTRQVAVGGEAANLRDHRPMAEVDAVVRADGDRTAADGPGTRLEVAHDLHEGRGYRAIARTPAVTTAATTITTANGARRHAGGAGGASGAPSARWTPEDPRRVLASIT